MTRFAGNKPSRRLKKSKRAGMKRAALLATVAALPASLGAVQVGLPAAGAATVAPSAPTPVWHVSRAPKLRVDVAAGCPASVAAYHDVVNTFPGPPLVPAGPKAGLVCRYGPSTTKPGPARLERVTRLDQAQANALDSAVRRLSLAPPTGTMNCPADFGVIAIIGLSFPGRTDVGLWYNASGCQTLDNGRIGSFAGGNPSFYNGFLSAIDRLSPPVVI
jgi:hypothetical protein